MWEIIASIILGMSLLTTIFIFLSCVLLRRNPYQTNTDGRTHAELAKVLSELRQIEAAPRSVQP